MKFELFSRALIIALASIAISAKVKAQCVTASHYGMESGPLTASGERYNPNAFTAAHRTFKFGTVLRVTNCKNGKSVKVRINNRGPFIKGREIDLSNGAARAIGINGLGKVKLSK
jgi:rare lipoprotein A